MMPRVILCDFFDMVLAQCSSTITVGGFLSLRLQGLACRKNLPQDIYILGIIETYLMLACFHLSFQHGGSLLYSIL